MARKKKPLIKRLGSLLLFVVITLIVFNFGFLWKQSMIAIGIADLNWESINKINIDLDQDLENRALVFTYNETVIVSTNSEIKLYDANGDFIIARKINSDSTRIIGMPSYFVVSDIQQGNIFVLDYLGNTTGEIKNLGPIEDIISANNNLFVVITMDNELSVYNHEGVLISNVQLPTGELLGLDVSKDKAQVIATILSSDMYQFNSKIITFSMESNLMIGGHNNYSDIVYGAKVYDDHIMIVDTNGKHAYRVGDSSDYTWDRPRDGELLYFEIDNNGSIFEIVKKDDINMTDYFLTGVNKDGKDIFKDIKTQKFNKIVLTQGKILLQNDRLLEIYSSDGILLASYESNKKINDVEWLNEDRVIIEFNDFIEVLELAY